MKFRVRETAGLLEEPSRPHPLPSTMSVEGDEEREAKGSVSPSERESRAREDSQWPMVEKGEEMREILRAMEERTPIAGSYMEEG